MIPRENIIYILKKKKTLPLVQKIIQLFSLDETPKLERWCVYRELSANVYILPGVV